MNDTYSNHLKNEIIGLLCNRFKFDKESSESFFSDRSSVAALRFKVGVGVLCISPVHSYGDGEWGFPPEIRISDKAIRHLKESQFALLRGIPPKDIAESAQLCDCGDFRGSLQHLARIHYPTRGQGNISAAAMETCEDLHCELFFGEVENTQQELAEWNRS